MGFFLKLIGADSTNQLAVKPRFGGAASTGVAHVSEYPMDVGSTGGAYSLGVASGVMAAGLAASSEIFQFRFVSATKIALVRSVRISAAVNTTTFGAAAAPANFFLFPARSWSVAGTLGTAVTLATNESKHRTTFATSEIASGDIRISTTVALGAGTKTLGSNALAAVSGQTGAAGLQIVVPGTALWDRSTGGAYPLTLATQEGLVVVASVPGTGTWGFSVSVDWEEVLTADF